MSEAKEPIEVVAKDTGEIRGYLCGTCRAFCAALQGMDGSVTPDVLADAKLGAQQCCAPACRECGTATNGLTRCCGCMARSVAVAKEAAEQRRLDAISKAQKVPAAKYTGWISWKEYGPMEGYFESVDALREWCEEEGIDAPKMVFGCKEEGFHISAASIIDDALEEHHEGARERISEAEEKRLQDFLDAWCAAQSVRSYYEDRGVVVVIGEEP